METTQNDIIERMDRIFDSFLSENFVTTNSVYFEKLISHLAAKENAYVLQAPFALKWVDKCVSLISEDFKKVNPKVISFMLNVCGLLTLNEWIVIELKELKIMDRILVIANRDMHQFNPSIKLGIIRLLYAVSQYSLGLAYIRSTKAWHYLIDYCNKDHTLYVRREARQLLYEFLYKFSVKTNDEQIVMEVLNEVLKPIHENVFQDNSDKIMINVDDLDLQHKLASTLDLISYIFQQTVESEEKTNVAHLCMVHHNIEVTLWKLTETTHNEYFLGKICTALTTFNFARLVYEQWNDGQIATENFNQFGISFFNLMKFCVIRREFVNFLKLAELNHVLWKKLGKRAPQEIQIENERVRFEDQLISFHLLPVFFIVKSVEFLEEEIFENYIIKVFAKSCEHTLRIGYAYRDAVLSTNTSNRSVDVQVIADLAYKSIHSILSMEKILEHEQAVLVFQAMIYALKEFAVNANHKYRDTCKHDETTANRPILIIEIPNVLYALLVGLHSLIQRYNITWKESIETICLVNCASVILENSNLSPRLAVQALKLEQISIEHFYSPNMALLVDNLHGSGLVCLGPIIIKRFHDTAWEVRDSTLELVNSIVTISCIKFPPFQKFLADNNICSMVYQMALNDCEPYVRASSLKCLGQFVSINAIWENELSKYDIIEHIFFVLYNESEGIVRKEAVCLLSKIYDVRKIPNKYKNTLYSTLAYCAVADLHWEVKVNALCFWKLEIINQFTNQGMIDGTFPPVTFSKEKKKIVTLTTKEINLRIVKILNDLSERGCLGVILKCLNDDCDLEVIKVTVSMVKRLFDKLKQYDYESIINSMNLASNHNISHNNSTVFKEPIEKMSIKEEQLDDDDAGAAFSDEVIEEILSAQDINFLITSYEKQMQLSGSGNGDKKKKQIDENYYKQFAHVSAKDFLSAIKRMDLDKLLQNHQEWFLCAESFVSLLDDIMIALKPDDETTIFADCY